jgi:ABC-type uncharacterized transport system ATPase subunit
MQEHNEFVVELRHITKRFPKIVANDDVSLSIRKGEIFALLGENGAGKSTLMSVLFGLYEPDEGEILIRGRKVRISSPAEASRLNIGMVHQHFKLVMNQSVTENIILGREPVKRRMGLFSCIDMKTANEEIGELSKKYGLDVDPLAKIEDLPVSTRQRVEILKMLYRNADILIFDEPTAVLTPQEIESLLDVIRSLRSGGKTIILITHKLDEVKQVADRCGILCRGKLVGVYDVPKITTQEMASLMVGYEFTNEEKKEKHAFGSEMLSVSHLTYVNEDKVKVVDDVSFTVHGGEILAIAGVAGNGQVEVADIIAGLLTRTAGSIAYEGKEIGGLSIRERTEAGIAYIPEDRQEVGLLLDYDLATNLSLKRYYQPPFCKKGVLDRESFLEQGNKLIDAYDIRCSEGCDTMVRSMSGGNQQKVIVAREISMDAGLLIFVQPTRGLDIGAIKTIHDRILALRDQGKAVLLVSLELDEIMELADTIAVMYSGRIQTVKSAASLTANQVGEYMMGVHHDEA